MTASGDTLDIRLVRPPAEGESREALWTILREIDAEFVPPLSARNNTTTRRLEAGDGDASGPVAYLQSVVTQVNLLAYAAGDRLAGMMSFRPRHEDEAIAAFCPCNYVSTVGVRRAARRKGVARALYDHLLHRLPADLRAPFAATRTWSTNHSHLVLLNELGFEEALRLPDHRGPGVDTVYLGCRAPAGPA